MNSAQQRPKVSFYFFAFLIIFIVGLGFGFFIGALQNPYGDLSYSDAVKLVNVDRSKDGDVKEVDFDLFWTVWDSVKERHIYQPVSDSDLFYGAIVGMVDGLADPYSVFMTPTESKDFFEEINGSFNGIGAEIGIKKEKLTIIAPLPGSPAEQAGIMPGDIVLAIDDLSTTYMTVNSATTYIRGEKGTTVTLTIGREGVEESLDIDVVRDTIQVDSVQWEMVSAGESNIAYINITHFNSDTALMFQDSLTDILLEQPDGVILDLRNNSGGFFDAAIEISSKFLDKDSIVVYEQSAAGDEKVYKSRGEPSLDFLETVVLVNGGSASASEILAGALRDYDKATLIGTTTFGKGTVQELQTFPDGSSLKLTVSRWLTPDKHLIQDVGIFVDYYIKRTAEDYSNDLDPQLDAAVSYFTNNSEFINTHQKYDPTTDVDQEELSQDSE